MVLTYLPSYVMLVSYDNTIILKKKNSTKQCDVRYIICDVVTIKCDVIPIL